MVFPQSGKNRTKMHTMQYKFKQRDVVFEHTLALENKHVVCFCFFITELIEGFLDRGSMLVFIWIKKEL